ncbi:MAG: ABC transporter permease [Bacteroidota bacterium]
MEKIWIIFKREYLNIVRKKTFLISTFLVPLSFALIFGIQILAAVFVEEENYTILVPSDSSPLITKELSSTETLNFKVTDAPLDSLKAQVIASKDKLLLRLPSTEQIRSNDKLSLDIVGTQTISKAVKKEVREKVEQAIKTDRTRQVGITELQLEELKFDLKIKTQKLDKSGEEKSSNTAMASIIGFAVCFLMYMLMGIYGSILMQGIIEEKSNRIVEVIVSSVKPFQLLMGKVLAIASVGMTQFLLWMVLTLVVQAGIGFIAGPELMMDSAGSQPGMEVDTNELQSTIAELQSFDWTVLWFFPFYFLGGFFLYGSLMAAAGSAVDNIQDAQQFTLPVTIPLILPILFVANIIQNPNGYFAIATSLFPFFSPMAMLVRMSLVEVPWYEVVLSMVLLVGAFLGCIWLAARIYRTGILMYGKKPSFKEVFRWIRT